MHEADEAARKAAIAAGPAANGPELHWQRLAHAAKARVAGELSVIRWVADNFYVDPVNIESGKVPSVAALNWLRYLQEDDSSHAGFWSQYSRLLPSKTQMEQDAARRDDGRAIFDLLDKIEAEQVAEARRSLPNDPGASLTPSQPNRVVEVVNPETVKYVPHPEAADVNNCSHPLDTLGNENHGSHSVDCVQLVTPAEEIVA